jgi:glycosyltransferase involved in cell wall biosynthesis
MPRLLRSSCRRSRLVTCLNDAERRYLLEHGWTTSERLVLVRQSVPRTFFVPREEYAPRVRRVLVLSQWLETKGVHYLVEGFSTFSRRHPDVRLWCYGTRASESEVLSAFPEDVRDRVVVVPSLQESELPVVFQQADVFVHASLSEGSSNAVNQAMAAALPMVLTPVGVVNDVLTDGESCLLVPAADALAIDAALQRVIDDAGLRRRLGQSARRVAEALMAEARNDRIVDRLETIVTAAGGA